MFRHCTAAALAMISMALAACHNDAESRFIHVRGHDLYVETRGHGPPLLLLHGGGGSIDNSFGTVIDRLAPGRRLIAIEQRDQGHSPAVDGPLSYEAMTEDTSAVLESLGVRGADVVGWSDGGIIGLMLAARHPALVRRVVASGANFAPEGLQPHSLAELRNALPRSELDRKLDQLWLTHPTPEELGPAVLARIKAPALIMAGEHDEVLPEHTAAMASAIKGAKLFIVAGSSHSVFSEQPALVADTIREFFAGAK